METILVDLHTFRLYSDGFRYYVDVGYWELGYLLPDSEVIEIDAAVSFALTSGEVGDAFRYYVDCNYWEQGYVNPSRECIELDLASFTLTTLAPKINFAVKPAAQSFTLTTQELTINEATFIEIGLTVFTLATQVANVKEQVQIDVYNFVVTTNDPKINQILRPDKADYALFALVAGVNEIVPVDAATFSLSTLVAGINEIVPVDSQTLNLTTQPVFINVTVNVDAASFALVTYDVVTNASEVIFVDAQSFSLVTNDPSIDESVIPDTTTFTLVTNDPSIDESVIPDTASFTLVTNDIDIDESVIPDPASFTLSTYAAGINAQTVVTVDTATFTLTSLFHTVNDIVYIDERVNFFFDRQGVTIIEVNVDLHVFDINKLPPTIKQDTTIYIEGISDTAPPELPTIAARATQTDAAANSVSITLPTHAAGQLIVSFISTADNTSITYDIITEGTRDGWFVNNVTSLSGSDTSLGIAWKVAESASESLTFDLFNARASKTITYVIDNANDLYLNSDNNFFGTDPAALFNPVSLEQEHACLMLAAVGAVNDGIVTVAPTGYTIEDTIQGGVSFDSSVSVCSKGAYLNTSEQPDSATLSTTTGWVSWTVAVINRDPNETVFRKRFNFNDRSEFFDGNGNLDNEWTEGNVGVLSHGITQTSGATSGLDEGFFLIRHTGVDESAGYIEWTGTFEQLGVTAGSQISGYGVPSIWYRAYNQNGGTARLGAPTYGYDAIEVTDANGTYTVLPAQAAQAADTGFIEVTGTQVDTATPLASNSTVTIRIYAEIQGNVSTTNIDYDDLFFFVDVIPAEVVKSGFTLASPDQTIIVENFIAVDLLEFNFNPLAANADRLLDIRDEVGGTAESPVTLPIHQAGDMLIVYWGCNSVPTSTFSLTTVESGWARGSFQRGLDTNACLTVFWKVAQSDSETLDVQFNQQFGPARTYAYSVIGGAAFSSSPASTDQAEIGSTNAKLKGLDFDETFPVDEARYFQGIALPTLYSLTPEPSFVSGPMANPETESFVKTSSPDNGIDLGVQTSLDKTLSPASRGEWSFDQVVDDYVGDAIVSTVVVSLNKVPIDLLEINLSTENPAVSPDVLISVDTHSFTFTANDVVVDFTSLDIPYVVDYHISDGKWLSPLGGGTDEMPFHTAGDLLVVIKVIDSTGALPQQGLYQGWEVQRSSPLGMTQHIFWKIAQSSSETPPNGVNGLNGSSAAVFTIRGADWVTLAAYNALYNDTFSFVRPRVGQVDPYAPDTADDNGAVNFQTLSGVYSGGDPFSDGPMAGLSTILIEDTNGVQGLDPFLVIEFDRHNDSISGDTWTTTSSVSNNRYLTTALEAYNSTVIYVNTNGFYGGFSAGAVLDFTTNDATINAATQIDVDTATFNLNTLTGGINDIIAIDSATITLTPNGVQTNVTIAPLSFSLNALQTADTIDVLTELTLTTSDVVVNAREVIEIDLVSFTFTPLIAGVGDVVAGNLVTFTLTPNTYLVNDVVGFPTIVFDLVQQELQANAKDIVTIDAVVSFALAVQEPTIQAKSFIEIVPAASFTLVQQKPLVNDIIGIDVVSFTLNTPTLGIDVDIIPDAESFTLVTSIVNVRLPINLDPTDAYELTTLVAGINEVVPVESATLSLSANDVVVNAREIIEIDSASLALVTQQPNINESVIPDAESYTLVTTDTRVNNSELIFIDLATINLVPQVAGVNEIVVIDTASLNLQTQDARINEQFRVLMDAAAFAITTQSVILNAEFIVFVDTALLTLTTNDSVTNEQFIVFVDTDSFAITTLLSNVREVQLIPLTEFNVATQDATINEEYQVMVDTASYSLVPLVAGINEIVPVDAAALNITALDVIVNEQFIAFIDPYSFSLVEQVAGINDIIAIDLVTQTLVLYQTDFDSTIEGFVGTVTEGGWELESATIGTTTAVLVAVMTSTTSAPVAIDTRAEGTWTVPVVEFT